MFTDPNYMSYSKPLQAGILVVFNNNLQDLIQNKHINREQNDQSINHNELEIAHTIRTHS
jgi:hypothetical protein